MEPASFIETGTEGFLLYSSRDICRQPAISIVQAFERFDGIPHAVRNLAHVNLQGLVRRRVAHRTLNILHGCAPAGHPGAIGAEGLEVHRRSLVADRFAVLRSSGGLAMIPARIAAGTITGVRGLYVVPPQANSSPVEGLASYHTPPGKVAPARPVRARWAILAAVLDVTARARGHHPVLKREFWAGGGSTVATLGAASRRFTPTRNRERHLRIRLAVAKHPITAAGETLGLSRSLQRPFHFAIDFLRLGNPCFYRLHRSSQNLPLLEHRCPKRAAPRSAPH